MPSPFPGMNPYLEQEGFWSDFHESYVIALRAALVPQVRPNFIAVIEQNVYVRDSDVPSGVVVVRPDAAVLDRRPGAAAGPGAATLVAPLTADYSDAELQVERESFIAIRDRELRQVVTVIELLSPTNKRPGDGHTEYVAKRKRYLTSGVNLVEIDLLRGWGRMPMPAAPRSAYCVFVAQRSVWPRVGIWPINLRDRLPEVPVPLADGHEAARLDLQSVLHETYDSAGFGDYIYNRVPVPPLEPADAEWVRQFVPDRSL